MCISTHAPPSLFEPWTACILLIGRPWPCSCPGTDLLPGPPPYQAVGCFNPFPAVLGIPLAKPNYVSKHTFFIWLWGHLSILYHITPTSLIPSYYCMFFHCFPSVGGSLCFSHFLLMSINLHFRESAPSYLLDLFQYHTFFFQLKEEIKCCVCLEGQCVCINNICCCTAFYLTYGGNSIY